MSRKSDRMDNSPKRIAHSQTHAGHSGGHSVSGSERVMASLTSVTGTASTTASGSGFGGSSVEGRPHRPARDKDKDIEGKEKEKGRTKQQQKEKDGDSSASEMADPLNSAKWVSAQQLQPGPWSLIGSCHPMDARVSRRKESWCSSTFLALATCPSMLLPQSCSTSSSSSSAPRADAVVHNGDGGYTPMGVGGGGVFLQDGLKEDAKGCHIVRLYKSIASKEGSAMKPVTFELDDTIPCYADSSPAEPIFSKPVKKELWFLLLEKALAKLFGGYDRLRQVTPAAVFRAITGNPEQQIWRKKTGKPWQRYCLLPGATISMQLDITEPEELTSKTPDDLFWELFQHLHEQRRSKQQPHKHYPQHAPSSPPTPSSPSSPPRIKGERGNGGSSASSYSHNNSSYGGDRGSGSSRWPALIVATCVRTPPALQALGIEASDSGLAVLRLVEGYPRLVSLSQKAAPPRFVKVRTPWAGTTAHLGPTSPDPHSQGPIGEVEEEEGTFWLEWEDFIEAVDAIHICPPFFPSSSSRAAALNNSNNNNNSNMNNSSNSNSLSASPLHHDGPASPGQPSPRTSPARSRSAAAMRTGHGARAGPGVGPGAGALGPRSTLQLPGPSKVGKRRGVLYTYCPHLLKNDSSEADLLHPIHVAPGFASAVAKATLFPNSQFEVSAEQLEDQVRWLCLADGRGWIPECRRGGGAICVRVRTSTSGPGGGASPRAAAAAATTTTTMSGGGGGGGGAGSSPTSPSSPNSPSFPGRAAQLSRAGTRTGASAKHVGMRSGTGLGSPATPLGGILEDSAALGPEGGGGGGGGYPGSNGSSSARGTVQNIRDRTSNVACSAPGVGRTNTSGSDAPLSAQRSLGGTCVLCRKPYSGYGTTCSSCRRLSFNKGSARNCARCRGCFFGFGDTCADCVPPSAEGLGGLEEGSEGESDDLEDGSEPEESDTSSQEPGALSPVEDFDSAPMQRFKRSTLLEGAPGDERRALSMVFLTQKLKADLEIKDNETVHDIEPRIRKKGENVLCPREKGEPKWGAAYVDVADDPDAGVATLMLSYGWSYTIADIVSALDHYCQTKISKPFQAIRVWICCFCVNQHRVKEAQAGGTQVSFEEFRKIFGQRVRNTGHMVGLLSPWQNPLYTKRVWCLFEAWEATRSGNDITVDFVLPSREANLFIESLDHGTRGLSDVWGVLEAMKVQNAEASIEEDKKNIFELIEDQGGYDALNKAIKTRLQSWFVRTAASSRQVTEPASFSPLLTNKVVDLLTQLGNNTHSQEVARRAIELCQVNNINDHRLANLYLRLARNIGNLGRSGESLEYLKKASSICSDCHQETSEILAVEAGILRTEAATLRKMNQLNKAFDQYAKTIDLYKRMQTCSDAPCSGPGPPKKCSIDVGAGWIYLNLGMVLNALQAQGKVLPGAKPTLHYFEKAEEVYAERGMMKSNEMAWLLRNRGEAHLLAGRLDKAEEDLNASLSIYKDLNQLTVENYGELCKSLGMLHIERGNYHEAQKQFEESRIILRRHFSAADAVSHSLIDLAMIHIAREDETSCNRMLVLAGQVHRINPGSSSIKTTLNRFEQATLQAKGALTEERDTGPTSGTMIANGGIRNRSIAGHHHGRARRSTVRSKGSGLSSKTRASESGIAALLRSA